MEVVAVAHAAGGLDDQPRQGIAVVGVDAVGSGVRLEGLGGEPLQQLIRGVTVVVSKEEGAGTGAAHEAGGVVEEHADGDVLVAGIRHGELRQVGGDRFVQRYLPLLHQVHHENGGVGLADGAHAVEDIVGEGAVFRAGIGSGAAGEDDLTVLPEGIGYALGPAILQSGLRRCLGGLGQRVSCGLLRRQGGSPQGQEQCQRQCQGAAPQSALLHKMISPFLCMDRKGKDPSRRRACPGWDGSHYTFHRPNVNQRKKEILLRKSEDFVSVPGTGTKNLHKMQIKDLCLLPGAQSRDPDPRPSSACGRDQCTGRWLPAPPERPP